MRHRALTRYKNGGKHRGKVVPHKEILRRQAQSLGYRHTLPQAGTIVPEVTKEGALVL
jgi:hypothetical protein